MSEKNATNAGSETTAEDLASRSRPANAGGQGVRLVAVFLVLVVLSVGLKLLPKGGSEDAALRQAGRTETMVDPSTLAARAGELRALREKYEAALRRIDEKPDKANESRGDSMARAYQARERSTQIPRRRSLGPGSSRSQASLGMRPPEPSSAVAAGSQAVNAPRSALPAVVLREGVVIHARVLTPVSSDSPTPGRLTALVVYPVLDSRHERVVFPVGTTLRGSLRSQPAVGQYRLGVEWESAHRPDGLVVPLAGSGSDPLGGRGVEARVSHRWLSIYGHAVGLSLVGAAAQVGQESGNGERRGAEIAIEEFSERGSQVTERILERALQRPPRFELRRGQRISLRVDQDVALRGLS